MIQCQVLAFIMQTIIHGSTSSKVDTLENADSECSDGVGWKTLDPGDENGEIWKVSRKNLDIILHLLISEAKIYCVISYLNGALLALVLHILDG